MSGDKWQQSQMPRPLNGGRQGALVSGAGAALTPGGDFTPIRYIGAQYRRVFVVDILNLIPTEETDFPLGYIFSPTRSPRPVVSGLCHAALNIILLKNPVFR
jgi:hypothetical protein